MSDIFYCDVCDIKLSSIYALRKHLKTILHKKKLNPVREKFSCLCGKQYKHRQTLYAHRKNCDTYINRPVQEGGNVEQAENEKEEKEVSHEPLLKKIEDLEKKLLEEKIENQKKEIESQKKEIDSLKKVAMLENKLASATKITNNTTNNITNNITINSFGNENIDYISEMEKIKHCKEIYKSFQSFLKDVHFHPDHPENHNVKLPNKKEPYCQIMKDNKWEYAPKDKTLSTMKENARNALEGTFEENKRKFTLRNRDRFEDFLEKYDNGHIRTNKGIDEDITSLLLNSKQ